MNRKEIGILCIFLVIVCVRYFYFLPQPTPQYETAVDHTITLTGMVSDYPDERDGGTVRYTITPHGQDFNILFVSHSDELYHYGDVVKVTGVLSVPESFETNTGKEFDYGRYLLVRDIFYIIKNGEIEKVGSGGNILKKGLFYIREKFEESLDSMLDMRDAGFVKGLLIGEKGGISKEDRDMFVTTGTIHVVALSGFNVMVVADAVIRIFSALFPIGVGYFLGGVSLVLFVIMAGAGSTAIRAGLMALLALYARHTGRTYNTLRALLIVSLVMLAFTPRVLFDVSFHLSVLATFGVIVLPVRLTKYFHFLTPKMGLRENAVTTLSAIILVTPYIMYVMGTVSLISFIANIFILPMIPFTMLSGFLAGIFGFIHPTIAFPFSYITHFFDIYTFSLVQFFSSVPFASIIVSSVSLFLIIGIYGMILYFIFKKQKPLV